MTEPEWLAEGFEQNRTRLRAVAYRMLGSLAEADGAVQEAWLRLSRSDASGVDNLGAWLTTIVARVCLNMLRSRKARHEEPMGVHVPDPVISRAGGASPEDEALLADSVVRWWSGASAAFHGAPRSGSHRQADAHDRGSLRTEAAGPGERGRWGGGDVGWAAVRGHRLHRLAREDRGNRRDRRSGPARPARPGRPRRLMGVTVTDPVPVMRESRGGT